MKHRKKYLNPFTNVAVHKICNSPDPETKKQELRIAFLLDRITYVLEGDKYSKDVSTPDYGILGGGLKPVANVEVTFKGDDSDDPLIYGVDICIRGRESELLGGTQTRANELVNEGK